jgi:anti-sigma regulatory factor (Ser/Thr protein kinase)
MANDFPAQEAEPDGRPTRGRLKPPWRSYGPPQLVLPFDAGTLARLRAEVQAFAVRSGFPDDRVGDLVLAVHELAANAIEHGAGCGLLRAWHNAGNLRCRVDDGDFPVLADGETPSTESVADLPSSGPDGAAVRSLPCEQGHGLWVVRQAVDQMQTLTSPNGTSVLITLGAVRGGQL